MYINKKWLTVAVLVAVICLTVALCACENSVVVVFMANNEVYATVAGNQGEPLAAPQDPQKSGSHFVGWFDNENCEGSPVTLPQTLQKSTTYYAKFAQTATLVVDDGTGAQPASYQVAIGANLLQFLADQNPSQEGLTFGGWTNGNVAITQDDTMPASGISLSAQWLAPYSIKGMMQELDGTYQDKGVVFEGQAPLGQVFTPAPQIAGFEVVQNANAVTTLTIGKDNNQYLLWFNRKNVTLSYQAGLDSDLYTGSMDSVTLPYGSVVTIAQVGFVTEDYFFQGWSTQPKKAVDPNYAAGREFILSQDITLYAVWLPKLVYTDVNHSGDEVIINISVTGLGSAVLVRSGQEDKLGFYDDYNKEATFYFGDSDSDTVYCKMLDNATEFLYRDSVYGVYLSYYYEFDKVVPGEMMALDGYGLAVYAEYTSDGWVHGRVFGRYSLTEQNDYAFEVLEVETQAPTGDVFYFAVDKTPYDEESDGTFIIQGLESGSFYLYDNGSLEEYQLQLNGYGSARLYGYTDDGKVLVDEGTYKAGPNYDSFYGEWQFISKKSGNNNFYFVLDSVLWGNVQYDIFIQFDEAHCCTLTGDGFTLQLDGYGVAEYTTSDGIKLGGSCVYGETLLTITLYNQQGEYFGVQYFTVDWAAQTVQKNPDGGYILDGTTLVQYVGTSTEIVIPQEATSIADAVFSSTVIDGKIVSVTIHDGVVSIGQRAFQNNYTLQVVYVLGTTPAILGADAFRWPGGDFKIVVPDGCGDAYRAADGWSVYAKYIFTAEELANLPEFQVDENGVLIKYNVKVQNPQNLQIVIPDEITEIGEKVFLNLNYIASVNLNNVTTIGKQAFALCEGLTSVLAPNVTTLGEAAFQDCINIQTITLPSVVTIGNECFLGCNKLTSATIGEHIQRIGDRAFAEVALTYHLDESGMEYVTQQLFVLQLLGTTAPSMGVTVFASSSFRVKVPSVDVAVQNFYTQSTWRNYCVSLLVEGGDEVGLYYNISSMQTSVLNGRLEMEGIDVMLYKISAGQGTRPATFYMFNKSGGTYNTYTGSISDDRFQINYEGYTRIYVREGTSLSYTNGDDTLSFVAEGGAVDVSRYSIPATFNGQSVTLNVSNVGLYFDQSPLRYNVYLSANGTFTYTTCTAPYTFEVTAADGSHLTFNGKTSGLIEVTGNLKDVCGLDLTVVYSSWIATKLAQNVYVLSVNYQSSRYSVTVTVSGETFTYQAVLANTMVVCRAASGDYVAVYKNAQGQITDIKLSFRDSDGHASSVDATYVQQGENTYIFTVNDTIYVDDGITVTEEPNPLNGRYQVTIDLANQTCTIVKLS